MEKSKLTLMRAIALKSDSEDMIVKRSEYLALIELAEATTEYVMGRTIFKDGMGKALAKIERESGA